MPFTIAIAGRPNVGKSTLFNRLTGRRLALVHDRPGVTRDRREAAGALGDLSFTVVDTAGLDEAPEDTLQGRMHARTREVLADVDVVLFLVDSRAGVSAMDESLADTLRTIGVPVVVVANKAEGRAGEPGFMEAYGLGLGDPVALSAEHGEGLDGLYEALAPYAAEAEARDTGGAAETAAEDEKPLHMAIVGRPNVGKSTLVNQLVGEARMLTGPEPGVTREAIAIPWAHHGHAMRLVDTAGLRRKTRIEDQLEQLSARESLRAIDMAQVVVLLLDGLQHPTRQDGAIARKIIDEGRALVVAVNKWDQVTERKAYMRELRYRLHHSLPQVRDVPAVPVSAATGENVDDLVARVKDVFELWSVHLATADLNRWLEAMTEEHPPPLGRTSRRIKLRYMTQAKTRPPTFVIFCNRPEDLPETYERYLLNGLREAFDLPGIPIRLRFRKQKNPYA